MLKIGLIWKLLNGGGLRVDSKEAQGLYNKTAMAEGVSSNLGRRIWIGWFGRVPVRMVRSEWRGSDGLICTGKTDCPIWFGRSDLKRMRPAVGGGRRRLVSTVARRRSSSKSMLRGSNRVGLGSVVISVTRVIHLSHLRASKVLGDTVATAEAGLGGGARQRVPFWPRGRLRSTTSSAKRIRGMC
jgi:hypothetical protein